MNLIYKPLSEKRLINEASLSTSSVAKILIPFNRLLQKKIGKQLFGSPEIYDLIQTGEGKFYTFDYDFGSGFTIRYKISTSNTAKIDSIDFFLKPYASFPTFTLKTQGINLIQLLDIVATTIKQGKTSSEAIVLEQYNKRRKYTEADGKKYIKQLADNLPNSASGFKKYLLSYEDPQELGEIISSAKGKAFEPIMIKYNIWARKNKETLYTNFITLRGHIFQGQIQGGLKQGAIVEVEPAKKQKEKPIETQLDKDLEKEAEKFKGTVSERFKELEDEVESVASGGSNSLIILGDPGVGKTYTVEEVLKRNGYSVEEVDPQIEWEQDEETGKMVPIMPTVDPSKFILVKGKVTAPAVYQMLYMYNGALIVFDDTDDVFKGDPNLIKAATDDKVNRKISSLTKAAMTGKTDKNPIPPSFIYRGRVIFVSNRYVEEIDTAILSRGGFVEINLTSEEMIERAKMVTPKIVSEIPGATKAMADEVLEFLLSISDLYAKLDLRTYSQSIKKRVQGAPDWKNRIARTIIAKAKAMSAGR